MSGWTVEGPYDYAREQLDAENAEPYDAKRGVHENDVPTDDEEYAG